MKKTVKNVITTFAFLVTIGAVNVYAAETTEVLNESNGIYHEYENIMPFMSVTITQNNVRLFDPWRGPSGYMPGSANGWLNSGDHVTVLGQYGGYFRVRVNRMNGRQVNYVRMMRIEGLW